MSGTGAEPTERTKAAPLVKGPPSGYPCTATAAPAATGGTTGSGATPRSETDRLFAGIPLCLRSYAAAITGRPVADVSPGSLPPEWFGDVEHTHRAIDDALGYAHLLVTLHRIAASRA